VATNGSLTGYAGGVSTKAWLLDHERDVVVARTAP
jgi:O6-methylguanine-DNA--protein-cysteine methyltransferase